MDQMVLTRSLSSSHEFFAPVNKPRMAARGLTAAAPSKGVFQSDSDGLMTCILLEQKVSPELQTLLDSCKQHLIDLCGLSSSYVRTLADKQKNPNLVYDTTLWQNVYNHLPLMGPSKFESQTFSQSCKGVEIATKFLEAIIEGVASGGAALAPFTTFLQSLGGNIQAGYKAGNKEYHVGAITITLEEIKIGNNSDLLPKLKGYFIDFTEQQREWSSSCASYSSYDMNFSYRVATSLFNYKALDDADVKAQFDSLIHGSQIDDIKNSSNFFNGQA